MTARSVFTFEAPGGRPVFSALSNGKIICNEKHSEFPPKPLNWCNHIQKAAVLRWDAQAIWVSGQEQWDSFYLEIPMFPNDNLWASVELIKVDSKTPVYAVDWHECPTNLNHATRLCYLNPGEGRNVIRQVLVEYMWADRFRVKSCKAGHHNYSAEMRWQQDTKSGSSRLAPQYWSVYTTEQCLTCRIGDPSSDPSLIPDTQKTVWNR